MMKKMVRLLSVLMVCFSLLLSGCIDGGDAIGGTSSSNNSDNGGKVAKDDLVILMLDIGQGDAILIKNKEQTVLIDNGDIEARDKLLKELSKADVNHINKMILTHPHADHIGGTEAVLKNIPVDEIYDNGMISTSKLYTGYVKMAKEKKIPRKSLKEGDVLDFGGGVTFKVFYPTAEMVKTAKEGDKNGGYKHDPNNESIVGMLNYGSFNMLFTGDAEGNQDKEGKAGKAEAVILKNHGDELNAQILKSPHHGSRTSADLDYLKAIQPREVLISLAEGNSYGHPHKEAMERYEKVGAQVYQTNMLGTIKVTTNGKAYSIRGEKQ